MSVLTRNPWLKHLAVVLVTVLSLGSLTVASTPAEARVLSASGFHFLAGGITRPHPTTPMVITGTRPMDIPGAFLSAAHSALAITTTTTIGDEFS